MTNKERRLQQVLERHELDRWFLGAYAEEDITLDIRNREETDARERQLWGKRLEDKRFLQRRDFDVVLSGGKPVLDGRKRTWKEFNEIVARYRRLCGEK